MPLPFYFARNKRDFHVINIAVFLIKTILGVNLTFSRFGQ
jgi:hypothetical protein